jgi:hypothetical protein
MYNVCYVYFIFNVVYRGYPRYLVLEKYWLQFLLTISMCVDIVYEKIYTMFKS